MQTTVLLLSVVNALLAVLVIIGGRYIFRRMERLEESVHQLDLRTMSPPPKEEAPATISETGWNE